MRVGVQPMSCGGGLTCGYLENGEVVGGRPRMRGALGLQLGSDAKMVKPATAREGGAWGSLTCEIRRERRRRRRVTDGMMDLKHVCQRMDVRVKDKPYLMSSRRELASSFARSTACARSHLRQGPRGGVRDVARHSGILIPRFTISSGRSRGFENRVFIFICKGL